MIRLFVGTDPQQTVAEQALAASVELNTDEPVEITWMRQGDQGWEWGGRRARWATPFTMFRWYVPHACGYQGRAIYVDVDMLILGSLRELWDWKIPRNANCAATVRPEVMVWQCDRVPRMTEKAIRGMLESRVRPPWWRAVRLPPEWDHLDRLRDDTKLLHFTVMRTQPWKPYPDRFPYDTPHPDPKAVDLFWEYATC